jgi:eukaryotic-like serine/threonine-protein kinase
MKTSRWQKIERIFNEGIEMSPPKRRRFVEEECRDDLELCQEILVLIENAEDSEEFLSDPVYFLGAQLLDKEFESLLEMSEFGAYKLTRLIGRGGIGAVFEGEDLRLGRTVALKILPMILEPDDDRVLRFRREAQIACSILHSNVTQIYEFDSFCGYFFIAMEYVSGRTLRNYLKNNLPSLLFALQTVRQIAEGLEAAHKLNIMHRDIKPENIMLTVDNSVKILDFGLAKPYDALPSHNRNSKIGDDVITLPGLMLGTVAYMSPEQSLRKKIDARSDIWSFGVILYEMLMGENPFVREHDIETIHAIIKEKPARLDEFRDKFPEDVFNFINKCLEKEPADRYGSASELKREVNKILKAEKSSTKQSAARHQNSFISKMSNWLFNQKD